jgi:hypothetical protein
MGDERLPSILPATSRASAGDFTSCTPPLKPLAKVPFPRPPAWTWAFTTRSFVPSSRAICSASSAVVATLPAGVAAPNFCNNSFAWYS